jgi:holliday junction DNA helicase RuvA
MIAYISGKLIRKTERSLIIDINGLGYEVFTPSALIESSELHLPIQLHIQTVVREDDISLYGFDDQNDLKLFQQLTAVNGVGPRIGLDILGAPVKTIQAAILSSDTATLTQIKGIGKKTAQRIILELKEKITPLNADELESIVQNAPDDIKDEVVHALLGLGYKRGDITRIFRGLKKPISNSEEMIKYFLKNV